MTVWFSTMDTHGGTLAIQCLSERLHRAIDHLGMYVHVPTSTYSAVVIFLTPPHLPLVFTASKKAGGGESNVLLLASFTCLHVWLLLLAVRLGDKPINEAVCSYINYSSC